MRGLGRVVLVVATVLAVVSAPSGSAGADPAGTVPVNPLPTRQTTVSVLSASPAGVLYREGGVMLPSRTWVKPSAGSAPIEVNSVYTVLKGSVLFGWDGAVRFLDLRTGREQSCASGPGAYTETGWVSTAGGEYWRTTISDQGCTRVRLGSLPDAQDVVAASDTGFLVQTLSYLSWVPGDDLTALRRIDTAGSTPISVKLLGDSIAWTEFGAGGSDRLFRSTTAGGMPVVTGIGESTQAGADLTETHTAWTTFGKLGTVPAGGGTPVQRAIGGVAVSNGTWFYFASTDGSQLLRAVSATDEPEVVLTMPLRPNTSQAIGLGAGRVATTDATPTWGNLRATRHVFVQGSLPPVGPAADLGQAQYPNEFGEPQWTPIVQDGRRTGWIYGGRIRLATEGGATRTVPFPEPSSDGQGRHIADVYPMQLSGTRLLWATAVVEGDAFLQFTPHNAYLYDIRANTNTLLGPVTGAKFALWGNYLVRAKPDGSITRTDLSTGRVVGVKGPGSPVTSLDALGSWVAWALCAPSGSTDCATPFVAYRNVSASTPAIWLRDQPVQDVRLVNDALYFSRPNGQVFRTKLGTATPAFTAAVARSPEYGWGRPAFDVDDETLAWVDAAGRALLAPQPAFSARPRFLGNPIAPASLSPNGDGRADTWIAEFPISKRVTRSCAVAIRSATRVVRVLGCGTVTGSAVVSWNGRDSAGRLAAKAGYTWTLTASDYDGAMLRWDGSATPVTGTVRIV